MYKNLVVVYCSQEIIVIGIVIAIVHNKATVCRTCNAVVFYYANASWRNIYIKKAK